GGPSAMRCPPVLVSGRPLARVGDMAICVGPPDVIVMGSPKHLVGGMPAARMGDMTVHGGVIVQGAPNVLLP
ncbi:PAAR domain-containing protein, partial [Nostoc sp. NIES-2111]